MTHLARAIRLANSTGACDDLDCDLVLGRPEHSSEFALGRGNTMGD